MNINGYIDSLRARKDLLTIDAEIDGRLEIASVTDLVCKRPGPGLLFNKVRGASLSVATNLFGSDQRMASALGFDSLDSFGRQLTMELRRVEGASSAQRLHSLLKDTVRVQQLSARKPHDPNLQILPDLRYWSEEERSFLTLAVVISRAPHDGLQNYGLYRVGVVDGQHLTLNFLPGSGGGMHLAQWQDIGDEMPVAIVLGADPALLFAAAASLPHDCSEEGFSAYLEQSAFKYTACQSVPLECPSSGQIVIEGRVVDRSLNEGPFGCYIGQYGGSNNCPLVKISALSMVNGAVLPLTVAGPLPMEDCWIAKANLEIIRARLALDIPHLSTIEMPLDTAFHGLYFVRSSDKNASAVGLSQELQGLDYLRRINMLILLRENDEPVSEENWREVLKKLPSKQFWQNPAADLKSLLDEHPPVLVHDTQLQQNLLRRLQGEN